MLSAVVVDDDAAFRALVRMVLEAGGKVEVVGEADNGEQAVALVAQLQPNVVLMDIEMPRRNGVDAAREIRRRFPQIRVVFITGAGSPAHLAQEVSILGPVVRKEVGNLDVALEALLF